MRCLTMHPRTYQEPDPSSIHSQYPSAAFKIPTLFGWIVVVNGKEMYEDIKRAPEEELSLLEQHEQVSLWVECL